MMKFIPGIFSIYFKAFSLRTNWKVKICKSSHNNYTSVQGTYTKVITLYFYYKKNSSECLNMKQSLEEKSVIISS